jgi:GT2 family glycosyltransferase
VLISTMDRPAALRRCLQAIRDGTSLPSALVIVDQSVRDDSTLRVAEEAQRSWPSQCQVTYVRSSGGMARGQNDGFARIHEAIVMVTDDDCVPAPDWVETAVGIFESRPDLGLIGGRVLPLGTEDVELRPVASRTSTVGRDLDHRSDPWDLGSGNNFAVRSAAVQGIGGNDERLGPGAEFRGAADMDLFRRILRSGSGGRYEPDLVVEHEQATQGDRRRRQVPYGYGMGIACALWWRQGDRGAARIALRYLRLRLRRAQHAVRSRRMGSLGEEALVLGGAARGILRGCLVRDPQPVGLSNPLDARRRDLP